MRKIVVNLKTYYWRCGRSFLEIRASDKRKLKVISIWELKGVDPQEVERARWKGYCYVTPKEVEQKILELVE